MSTQSNSAAVPVPAPSGTRGVPKGNPRAAASAALVLLASLSACWDDAPFQVSGEERALVVEDPVILAERIEYFENRLTIEPLASTAGPDLSPAHAIREAVLPVTLTMIVEVDPPELDGVSLQASHLTTQGDRAYVSYNIQGPVLMGGVDAFDGIGRRTPVLTSGLLFTDTDVSAVEVSGDDLFLATGTTEGSHDSTAVLEVAALRFGGRRISPVTNRTGLSSFVATGLAVHNGRIFITSGDTGGGLTILDQATEAVLSFDPFPDARAIVAEGSWVVAMKGTPAGLRVYDRQTGAFVRQIDVGGATIPESKSGLDISGDVAAVAAGDEGVKLVHLGSGEVIAALPLPVSGDPDFVSNDVAIHNDLVFVANGGGGLWAAQASGPLGGFGPGEDPSLTWVGRVGFPVGTSVNFVTRKGSRLVVAGGFGGLKIVAIDG